MIRKMMFESIILSFQKTVNFYFSSTTTVLNYPLFGSVINKIIAVTPYEKIETNQKHHHQPISALIRRLKELMPSPK